MRERKSACRLLVPTSTLAQHLRNTLAREGLVFSPACIDTLGHFVNSLTPTANELTPGTLSILVDRYVRRISSGRYFAVRDLPGFSRALASAIDSFTGAGGTERSLEGLDPEFQQACRAVLAGIEAAGLCTRAARLRSAATRVREQDTAPGEVWVTGFSSFTAPEAELICALAERSPLTVALSDSPAADRTRTLLVQAISDEQRFEARPILPQRVVVSCSTPENEAAEVARRILGAIASGRAPRHIGVVLRNQGTAANLRLAFDRFGIPAQFHFARPLEDTPPVQFINAILDAVASGWDLETSVAALRMHGSPLERSGDEWEYTIRERLPGKGLATLREEAPSSARSWLDQLAQLGEWPSREASATQWQASFDSLRRFFLFGPIHDRADADRIEMWRNDSAALELYSAAVTEAAGTFRASEAVRFSEFRAAVNAVVATGSLWPRDRRHDVVHVIDAAEARHWRLPLIFVCGLIEGEFPRRFTEDPILPDKARRHLSQFGVLMPTASQRQEEEQCLFDTTLRQATERTVLTYPVLTSRGDPLTQSFALGRAEGLNVDSPSLVRPRALRPRSPEPDGAIGSPKLLDAIASRFSRLSASAIETFVSCPWQFFARRTLRLQAPPERIWERLDLPAQGNIAHRAAELRFRDGLKVEEAFDRAFDECCEKENIPGGYRTEAIRLELLHNVRLLLENPLVKPGGGVSLFEHPFSFQLDGLQIDGKMDRVDVSPDGSAVVFDYKYSRPDRLRETFGETEEGLKVQGGLYLRALQELGYRPSGLIWFGFKREVSTRGWVLPSTRPDLQSKCSVGHLDEVAATAAATAATAAASIVSGVVAPAPEDEDHCERCEFQAACRFEVMARRRAATVGGAHHAAE